jgi:hypothetical protein
VTRPAIAALALPEGALLDRYCDAGAYTDCFAAEVAGAVDLAAYITAFYNSRAFRPERWLLGWAVKRPATADDVARLAHATSDRFSAWSVEARTADQLLLCDFQGRTRSWLMVQPLAAGTRLHFGSAVVPATNRFDAVLIRALTGFHRLYSRMLLRSALRNLRSAP